MIVYLSGFQPNRYFQLGVKEGVKHYLYSFHTFKGDELEKRWRPEYKIFIDSGGYSARVRGVKIDVKEYCKFLNTYSRYITIAANLDTNDTEETLANQRYLMANSTAPILPVYHYSDYTNPKYRTLLDDWIAEGKTYIGVGGVAGVSTNRTVLQNFLSYVFAHTRDKVRVHGFGITSHSLLNQFPFYSVDSTSWMAGARYGGARVIGGKNVVSYKDKRDVIGNNLSKNFVEGSYMDRLPYEIRYWPNYEKEITELWKARGVVWDDI